MTQDNVNRPLGCKRTLPGYEAEAAQQVLHLRIVEHKTAKICCYVTGKMALVLVDGLLLLLLSLQADWYGYRQAAFSPPQ